jgi:hypothetical protein
MKSQALFKEEIITKMGGSYKNVLPNNKVNFNQSWYKSSLDEGDSSLFKQRRYPFSKGK